MKLFIYLMISSFVMTLNANDFEKGKQLFQAHQWDEAKDCFERFLKSNPNHIQTMEYLGDIFGKKKNWDKALVYYRKIKDFQPKNAHYQYKYGGALGMKAKETNKFKALGMLDEVEASFLKAAELDPKHVDTRLALVVFYMELPTFIGGSETKARIYANQVQSISPIDGFIAFGTIEEYKNQYKKAEQLYLKAYQSKKNEKSFQKLYDLYINKLKDANKAKILKSTFDPL